MDTWNILRTKKISPRKKLVLATKKGTNKELFVLGFRGGKKSFIIDKGTNKDLLEMQFEKLKVFSPTKLELAYKLRKSPFTL